MYEQKLDNIEKASVYKTAFMTFSSDTWQDIRVFPLPKAPCSLGWKHFMKGISTIGSYFIP